MGAGRGQLLEMLSNVHLTSTKEPVNTKENVFPVDADETKSSDDSGILSNSSEAEAMTIQKRGTQG